MPEPEPAAAEGEDPPAHGHDVSRATILPSQSTDHCTPPVMAEGIIYPVLGDPVGLDPCSNENSIIRARRCVMLPDNGLAIEWYGTVFCNPEYGSPEIDPWVEKCVESNRLNGAEIIGLFPANVSSEWFDMVAATARAAFFWGPGDGGRRLQFIGTEHKAAFASVVAYWGPHLPTFVRHAIRYCHPWFPEYDLRLVRAMLADASGSGEPVSSLAIADDLLCQCRNDDLAAALVALGDVTLGKIMDYGKSTLLCRLRALSAYELGSALVCSSRPGTHWIERRLPRTPPVRDPRQANLAFKRPKPADLAQGDDEGLDDFVWRLLDHSEDGLGSSALMELTGEGRGRIRGALRRLREANRVIKKGTTKTTAYTAVGEEG